MPYTCRECAHYDITDQWCTERRKYYPPDDSAQYCKEFILNRFAKDTSGGCFLTSACVSYMGLPDDCHELTTLRRFRDSVLAQTNRGKLLVEEYYAVAPDMVEKIDVHKMKSSIYEFIYKQIKQAVSQIEEKHFDKAENTYINMVKDVSTLINE